MERFHGGGVRLPGVQIHAVIFIGYRSPFKERLVC
jgi:hypothetical protein